MFKRGRMCFFSLWFIESHYIVIAILTVLKTRNYTVILRMFFCLFFQIQFPSGTSLEVKLSYYDAWTLELQVNPSIAAENRSEGLCGTVGTRKLLSPTKVDLTKLEKNFTRSWKYVHLFQIGFEIIDRIQFVLLM